MSTAERRRNSRKAVGREAKEIENMKKEYTAEEKKAYFAEQKKNAEQMLVDGVTKCYTEGNFKNYLQTVAKFHNYSLNNCLLIAMQCPEASYVAGYKDWQKKFKRHVRQGETAIKILAPIPCTFKTVETAEDGTQTEREIKYNRFRVVNVFDYSQTEGKELPQICKTLTAGVENYDDLLERLKEVAPVPVAFEEITTGAHGYYSREENRIVIDTGMPEAQTIKTLVHEIAHSILHSDAFCDIPRAIREVQAESVAFMVCSQIGVDSTDYSFEYVASWAQQDMKSLTEQMDTVRKTADAIVSRLS